MRSTVGPLPPAVYWRRRAIVLGSVVLVLLLLGYACSSPSSQSPDASPVPAAETLAPGESPTGKPTENPAGNSAGKPSAGQADVPSAPPTPGGTPPAADSTPCTDDEITVTVRADRDPVPSGAFLRVYLKIKNISSRTCTRDIGPDSQEAQVRQGENRIWSSDDCDTRHGANVMSLAPGADGQEFFTDWNTTTSSSTTCAGRALVPQGVYQMVGRFGTKVSAPVTFRVT